MKITIATGIYPPEIGGPAEYSRQLFDTLSIQNHEVSVVTYGGLKQFTTGFRHFLYFFKLIINGFPSDYLIVLDTFSTGLPSLIFAKLFRIKMVVRVAGDFLWESYVGRTKKVVLLSEFYKEKRNFNLKEKIIFHLTGFILRRANGLVFSTEWQRDIMLKPYRLSKEKISIIENYYPVVDAQKIKEINYSDKKIFLSPSRDSFIKNKKILIEAFDEVSKKHSDIVLDTKIVSHEVLMEKIPEAYAIIVVSISEVSPNLVLDALKYAIPVIVTRDTGIKDRIKDLALFVNPQSSQDISSSIEKLLDTSVHKDYRNKILNSKYSHSWNEIAQEYIDLYNKI